MSQKTAFVQRVALLVTATLLSAVDAAEVFDYHSVRGRASKGLVASGRIEGESLPMSGVARVQGMRGYGPHWSGDAHLLWYAEPGGVLETSFRIERAGRYKISAKLTRAPDYGIVSLLLNGRLLKSDVDLYGPKVVPTPLISLGEHRLASGAQKLAFRLDRANPQAVKFRDKHFLLGLDFLELEALDPPPEEVPGKDVTRGPAAPRSFAEVEPILSMYCSRCHGGEKTKGRVDLRKLRSVSDLEANIELATKVLHAVERREMPPEDEKQPSASERGRITALFDAAVERYLSTEAKLVPTSMRRMNRYEYSNAVRDLLGLRGPVYPLPEIPLRGSRGYYRPDSGRFPDAVTLGNRALGKNQVEQKILRGVTPFAIDLQSEHGFNNRGEELSLSPILFESLLKLARSIVSSPDFDAYTSKRDGLFRAPPDASAEQQRKLASERIAGLLERAFRREVSEETVTRYTDYFQRNLERTASFEKSMKTLVAAVLSSPRFLYVVETKHQVAAAEKLNAYELATRMSFFLWSSIPDEELLAEARSGRLLEPGILEAQTRRLLEDPRSQSLSQNFARQWLRLDQLITAVPDFDRFPRYYSRIGCEQWKFGLQTMVEPLLLFESILVEDRSIMLLVDSNYSYRSDELESWYRDEKPFGDKGNRNRFNTFSQSFRRRPVSSRREGGIITTAATMTMTSSPLRTSPITRGAWFATVVLNSPPPPPPDAVPEIEADDAVIEAKGLTLRQRLKEHQENESCASCHEKIDPLGFALENFNAVGRWRSSYGSGLPIDASGKIRGKSFSGIVELKDRLLENPEWFQRAFCEHMLSYALGRGLEIEDRPAVDLILRRVLAARGQFSTVVLEIVKSYPFLHKTNQSVGEMER